MVFSSLQFIFIFMPVFFGCYYAVPDKYRNCVLYVGSMCFYLVGTISNPEHFILFILSIILDYTIGIGLERCTRHRKILLVSGITLHIISLVIFKYSAFVTDDIVLPIGISFYTFQGISYIADVYRGEVKAQHSLLKFVIYIAMFEQLIAGPIVTYGQVENELSNRKVSKHSVMRGIGIFIFGLGLKVLLANPIGKLWSQTCAIGFESISTPLAWMAIGAYSFQIYFDFFGYSLMAVGLGKMLGFRLPVNFKHPYTSLTMTEFWRRWHITLGDWFRTYVYIPLGGNREGVIATVRNLLVVWLLTGLWHGAGYNFVLWGVILFLIITVEKFFIGKYLSAMPVIGHIYMIVLIPLTWAVFAIDDIGQLKMFISRLFPWSGRGVWSVFRYDYVKYMKLYYPFFIAGILLSTRLPYRILKRLNNRVVIGLMLAVILCACAYCMYRGFDDPFLYFRF